MKKTKVYLICTIIFSILFLAALAFDIFLIWAMNQSVWFLVLGGFALGIVCTGIVLIVLILDIIFICKYRKHKRLQASPIVDNKK